MTRMQEQRSSVSEEITIADAASGTLIVPAVALEGPALGYNYGNTQDHVTGTKFWRVEDENGRLYIRLSPTFVAANVFLTKIVKKLPSPLLNDTRKRDVVISGFPATQSPEPIIPTGAQQHPAEVVIFPSASAPDSEAAAGLATNGAEAQELLTMLTYNPGESFEITLRNASGGALTGKARAAFELGRNPSDFKLREER